MKITARADSLACRVAFVALLVACAGCQDREPPPPPNPEIEAVSAVVHQLSDAMAANDSVSAAAAFHSAARIARVGDGRVTFRSTSSLLQMIASTEERHEEPMWDLVVNVDGNLAQAWAKYAFYRDGVFSHCGSDAFSFAKGRNGWQITQLTDTRRTEDCWHPPGREQTE